MNTPRRKGFTLVELLVVIAIIALLIAILAPSLKAAKELAKSSYCRSTLNALNKSALVYAEINKGYLMVYRHAYRTSTLPPPNAGDFTQAPPQTSKLSQAFTGYYSSATGFLNEPVGYGLVYAAGILGPADLFYCPAQTSTKYRLADYPKPWGSATGPASQYIRAGYMWNPWVWDWAGAANSRDATYDDDLVLQIHPNERCLTADLIYDMESTAHKTGLGAVWNLCYADGHVEPFENALIYQYFLVVGTAGEEWGFYQANIRPRVPGALLPEGTPGKRPKP